MDEAQVQTVELNKNMEEREIPHLVKVLDRRTGELGTLMDVLTKRLEGLLRPMPAGADDPPAEPAVSPMGGDLMSYDRRLYRIKTELEDILARLEV